MSFRYRLFTVAIVFLGFVSCQNKGKSNLDSFTEISVSEAAALAQSDDSISFIDVRTPGEIVDGKIDGALEIDFQSSSFETEIEKLDKDQSYIVYCRSGNRSKQCMSHMRSVGFKDVKNLDGGYVLWRKHQMRK